MTEPKIVHLPPREKNPPREPNETWDAGERLFGLEELLLQMPPIRKLHLERGRLKDLVRLYPDMKREFAAPELLPQAVDVILETKQASVSMLQRRLKLGYSRAARMVDQMEEMGIVGPFEGSKPRKILITKQQWQEMQYVQGTAPSEVLQAQTDFADVNEEEPEDDES